MTPAPTIQGLLVVPDKNPSGKREKSRLITPLPVLLMSVWVDYDGSEGADVYLHVFEQTEVPGNGIAPTLPPMLLSPNAMSIFDFGGCRMQGGVAVALSTTRDTLTLVTNASGWFNGIFHVIP